MTETEERVHQLAVSCQALLDELLRPHPREDEAAMQELRAAGVGESRIAALYPVELANYLRGIEILCNDERLGLSIATSPILDELADVRYRLRPEVAQSLDLSKTNAEEFVRAASPSLLFSIALVRLLHSAPLNELLDDMQGVASIHDAAYVKGRMEMLAVFFQQLRREQQVSNEWDPIRRLLLRLKQLPIWLGLHKTRGRN